VTYNALDDRIEKTSTVEMREFGAEFMIRGKVKPILKRTNK
jgi:hypothetical protein